MTLAVYTCRVKRAQKEKEKKATDTVLAVVSMIATEVW